jgi:hypothetical protein
MTLPRLALLIVSLALAVAAPASASERSEARRFAAAMEPEIGLTPEEGEALVAGMEARAAHVVATCLPSVKAAARKRERARTLEILYGLHVYADVLKTWAAWQADGDTRLRAIHTSSRVLRRARAARAEDTRFFAGMAAAAPVDFCAMVAAWEAHGFKGEPPEERATRDAALAYIESRYTGWLQRGTRLLWRHGATGAQRLAFSGIARWPRLREPAKDPVEEAIGAAAQRRTPGDGPTRLPLTARA